MQSVLLAMASIILAGMAWRLRLGAGRAERIRGALAGTVYQLLLPALVLHVLWSTPVDLNTVRIPLVAAASVLGSLMLAYLIYARILSGRAGNSAVGALLLASAFGNFTYLGLPVLTQTFGEWSQFVAIQFDLLASTPLLFTMGILVARHFGKPDSGHPFLDLLRVPAIWAAGLGLLFSSLQLGAPAWLDQALHTLGSAVIPLMLLSVGMALRWQAGWLARAPMLLPMLGVQLFLMPLIAWAACHAVGVPKQLLAPTVVEAAMPCMVLGLVICDRFQLDASLYAEAVTVSTLLSFLTLPLWLQWIF
ncbi:MAG: AEC family transporter [Zetaproteobacteria bacterium]|nr:MAG: AEC family transporter [Zetaproteobacteria bacterium]